MRRDNWFGELLFYVLGMAVLVGGPVLFMAYNEAASYRKFCPDTEVTTWDAIFLELRIDECRR